MSFAAVVGSKGQILIPSHLRRRYGLHAGTTVLVYEEAGRLVLAPRNFDAILALAGSLKDLPLEEELESERQIAREREDRQ